MNGPRGRSLVSPIRAVMSHLRLKTVIVMAVTIAILITSLQLVVYGIVQNSFASVETTESMDKLTVATNAIDGEMLDLHSATRDYAAWTDTYSYVKTGNATYVEVNLVNSTYENLRVQSIVVLDAAGAMLYGQSHYVDNDSISLPAGLSQHLVLNDVIVADPLNGTSITGILDLTGGMWLVSSQPILHSDGSGPVGGILMFLRSMDESERVMIEQMTLLSLTFYSPTDPTPASVLGPGLYQKLMATTAVGKPVNETDYTAWALLMDVHNQPGLILMADVPRTAHAEYETTSFVLSSALIIASLLFGVVTFFLMDRVFLSRINRLSDGVQSIGSKRNEEKKVSIKGEDEIAKLAVNINSMLGAIESRDKELLDGERKHAEQLEKVVETRTEELRLTNTELARQVHETEMKEEELRQSEERYRAVIEDQVDMIVRTRPDGTVTFANRAFCQRFGMASDDIVGKKLDAEVLGGYGGLSKLIEGIQWQTSPVRSQEFATTSSDASMRWENWLVRGIFDDEGNLAEVQSVGRDVTDRVKIDQEIMRTQKLESLGRMAGGIAHDYNNIMTSVVGSLALIRMEKDQARIHKRMEDIEGLVSRAKGLSEQLLTFSEGGFPIKDRLELEPLLKSCSELGTAGGNVHLKLAIDADLWDALADRGQMSQVFNHIISNAVDAMPEGGTLTISASNLVLAYGKGELPPGDYVELRFIDTGIGIRKEDMAKVLDPFFTTKPGGTGLGLPAASSIVRKHGGGLDLASEQGIGTVVTLVLPAITSPREPVPEVERGLGSGRILLMDDEMPILDVMTELMKYLGYEVDTARDGNEAVRRYESSMVEGTKYDIVIMDLTIPGGIGGREAVVKLREIDPSARVIVSSGYSNDPVMAEPDKYGFDAVLQKPYTMEELRDKLASVLSRGRR